MGKKGNVSDSECGAVVGVQEAGWIFPKTDDRLEFSCMIISVRGPKEKKEKHAVSAGSLDRNSLMTAEVKEEWVDSLELIERQQ